VHYNGRGSCTTCHRGNPFSDRKNIAHHRLIAGRYARFMQPADPVLREGNRLLEQYACRRCHVIGGRGNRLSADLDHATDRRSIAELARSIRQPALNMPDFRSTDQQVMALITALLSASGLQEKSHAARPQVVHFDREIEAEKDLFSIKCGPCHRVLTERRGALGRGNIGPNLSGLLTTFYPKTFRNSDGWDKERLRRWLENPRADRPEARMQPVRLTEAELATILDILRVEQIN
jgi:cytochrome c2